MILVLITDSKLIRILQELILKLMLLWVGSSPETPDFGVAFLVSIGLFFLFHDLDSEGKTRVRRQMEVMGMRERK